MTPDPKYFAKLPAVSVKDKKSETNPTYSKTPFGTCSHDDLFASTGNRAPHDEPMRMMNMDATRRLKYVSAPPPEPQLRVSSVASAMVVVSEWV